MTIRRTRSPRLSLSPSAPDYELSSLFSRLRDVERRQSTSDAVMGASGSNGGGGPGVGSQYQAYPAADDPEVLVWVTPIVDATDPEVALMPSITLVQPSATDPQVMTLPFLAAP